MAIEEKHLVTTFKSFSRANALPLDSSEVYESKAAAEEYAHSHRAYAGQTIKALVNGKYISYVLNPSLSGNLELTKVGVDASEMKQEVRVVDTLPIEAQEQGVIYITNDNKGSIWTGGSWRTVFEQVDGLGDRLSNIDNKLTGIDGTVKSAIDKIANDLASTQSILQTKIDTKADKATTYSKEETNNEIAKAVANAGHLKREIVESLPSDVNAADEHTIYMVKKAVGDKQQYEEFMVVNVSGIKSFEKIGDSAVDMTNYYTKKEVDGILSNTDGSGPVYNSVHTIISHELQNPNSNLNQQIDNKNQIQTEEITKQIAADKAALEDTIDNKIKEASVNYEKAGAVTAAKSELTNTINTAKQEAINTANAHSDEINKTLTGLINNKLDATAVDSKISASIGDIDGKTVKEYVDSAILSGGTDQSAAIEKAKQEAITAAKSYTDTKFTELNQAIDTRLTIKEF